MAFDLDKEREEIQNRTQIESLIENLGRANITLENYPKHLEKVENQDGVINSQLESLQREHRETAEEAKPIKKVLDPDATLVPIELYENSMKINRILKEAFGWKLLQAKMYYELVRKIDDILRDVKALEIKRDALKEIREDSERRNQLFIDTIHANNDMLRDVLNHKLASFDEKFLGALKMFNQDHRAERQQLISVLQELSRKKLPNMSDINDNRIEELFGNDKPVLDPPRKPRSPPPTVKAEEQHASIDDEDDDDIDLTGGDSDDIDDDYKEFYKQDKQREVGRR